MISVRGTKFTNIPSRMCQYWNYLYYPSVKHTRSDQPHKNVLMTKLVISRVLETFKESMNMKRELINLKSDSKVTDFP